MSFVESEVARNVPGAAAKSSRKRQHSFDGAGGQPSCFQAFGATTEDGEFLVRYWCLRFDSKQSIQILR